MRELALQVDALSNGCIRLKVQAIPDCTRPDQGACHAPLRINLEIDQETYFLPRLAIQQMCLVDDNDRLQSVHTAHEFNLAMQLPLGVAAIELRLTAELLK